MPDTIFILCGGASSRMGADKALLPVDRISMLKRITERCRKYFKHCKLLSGTQEYELPYQHIPDYIADTGPLGAIAGGLQHHRGSEITVIPVDMPLLEDATLRFLSRVSIPENIKALLGTNKSRLHPLVGIYHKDILTNLKIYLDGGNRSVRGFLQQIPTRTFELTDKESLNANTPDEYQNALNEIG